jgi:hypothetical protein
MASTPERPAASVSAGPCFLYSLCAFKQFAHSSSSPKNSLDARRDMDADCDFTDGQTLAPDQIQSHAHQLWEQSGDSQETLAAQIDRSQAAVSKALRGSGGPETRYTRICVDVIEHYCEEVKIHYPRGEVEVK